MNLLAYYRAGVDVDRDAIIRAVRGKSQAVKPKRRWIAGVEEAKRKRQERSNKGDVI